MEAETQQRIYHLLTTYSHEDEMTVLNIKHMKKDINVEDFLVI